MSSCNGVGNKGLMAMKGEVRRMNYYESTRVSLRSDLNGYGFEKSKGAEAVQMTVRQKINRKN